MSDTPERDTTVPPPLTLERARRIVDLLFPPDRDTHKPEG